MLIDKKTIHFDASKWLRDSAISVLSYEAKGVLIDLISYLNCTYRAETKQSLCPNCKVIVSDDQLSLAIGANGENVKLAAKLTGWQIDIRSLGQIDREVVFLKKLPGIGEKTFKALREAGFITAKDIIRGGTEGLSRVTGIGEKTAKLIPVAPEKKMNFDFAASTWEPSNEGKLHIWDYPDWDSNYIVAADVALGVGQDYSTAAVLDTDRKVIGLYRDNHIDPSKFGDLLFYLGRYYNNALLTVESNSMGVATLSRLTQMNYVNLYKQTKISIEEHSKFIREKVKNLKPEQFGYNLWK